MTTIQRCLEVSTAHLAGPERDELLPPDPGAQGRRTIGPCFAYYRTGDVAAVAFVLIADEDDRTWRAEWPTLAAVVDKAAELGATMLLVDPDADLVDGLPVYD